MEWQNASSSTTLVPIVPQDNEFLQNELYIYDQWGNVPQYLPIPMNMNDQDSTSGKPWVKANLEEEKYNENIRPLTAIQEWTPFKLCSKTYSTTKQNDSSLSPSVYKSDYWFYFIGTKDGTVRILQRYNLRKYREDFKFSEQILDISRMVNIRFLLVMTSTKLWQTSLQSNEVVQIGPVDDYLRICHTILVNMVITKSGNLFELALKEQKFNLKLISNIASRVENFVVVENLGDDARSGVLLAISSGNKIAILRLTRVGNEFCVRLVFQFKVYTEGSVILETSDDHLYVHALNGWRDRDSVLTALRVYSWRNLMQKRPSYEELFLPGYELVSMTHKRHYLVVTMSFNTTIVYDTIKLRRLYVITTP